MKMKDEHEETYIAIYIYNCAIIPMSIRLPLHLSIYHP